MSLIWLAWKIIVLPPQPSFFAYFKLFELSSQFGPAVITSILLLPIVIFDCLRFSNRFVGPMYRLRKTMRHAAEGLPVQPVRFRNDDFWQSVAVDFNALLGELEKQRKELAATKVLTEPELLAT